MRDFYAEYYNYISLCGTNLQILSSLDLSSTDLSFPRWILATKSLV